MRSPLNAILLVAALTLIVFTFTRHRVGANVLSRLITVERLVDAGTFAHDDTQFTESADSVMIDGKRYSSKQPTFTLVLAALAWPVSALTGAAVYTHQRAYLHWLVLCHQVLPYIVLLWFGARWLRARTDDPWVQATALLGLSFACLPYGYAVTLNNHTPAAIFLFFAWWLMDRMERESEFRTFTQGCAVGALCGLAASYELTAAIFTPLFALVAARHRLEVGAALGLSAFLATVPMFAGYYAISGSPVPFYIRPELYDYPGSYWRNPTGLDALAEPKWRYGFNALLGHRGWFSLTPFMAIGFIGLVLQCRARHWLSAAVLAGAAVVATYIVVKTHNYGGRALGMRWFAQFSPLFALGSLPALVWARERRGGRVAVYLSLALSAALIVEALLNNAFSPGGWVYGLRKVGAL
ncbi:MAG: hypothetical protein AAFU77_06390 [Myxococcota bacterium]